MSNNQKYCDRCKPEWQASWLCSAGKCFYDQDILDPIEVPETPMTQVKRKVEKDLRRDKRKQVVKNFFKGRNKAGRILYKLIGVASVAYVGADLTNILSIGGNDMNNLELLNSLDFSDVASIVLSVIVIGLIVWQFFVARKQGNTDLPKEARDVFQALIDARREDSDGGRKLTEAELRKILDEGADVASVILSRYGIGDGVNNEKPKG